MTVRPAFDRLLGPDARVAGCLASLFHPDLHPRVGNSVQLGQEETGLLSGVSRQRTDESRHELQRLGSLRIEFGGVAVLDLDARRCFTGGADER